MTSNQYQSGFGRWLTSLLPHLEPLVHPLNHHGLVMRLAVEDAFQAHQFVTPARGYAQQPPCKPMQIHGSPGAQRQRANPLGVDVRMAVIAAQATVLECLLHALRIPRLLVEYTHHVDLCPGSPLDVRLLIAGMYGGFRGSKFVALALITVIHNNVIGIRHLSRGLWMVGKLLHNMLGMRHSDHAIDLYLRVQRGIHQHPLEHRSWRGKARGLNHNALERLRVDGLAPSHENLP